MANRRVCGLWSFLGACVLALTCMHANGKLAEVDVPLVYPAFTSFAMLEGELPMEEEEVDPSTVPMTNLASKVRFNEPNVSGAAQIQRYTDITWDKFGELMRKGDPFIVTDVSRDWIMKGWTCESVGKEFANEKMRQEYNDKVEDPDALTQSLGDLSWVGVKSKIKNDPNGPQYAPFYWDVKDRKGALKRKMQERTRLPYFMRGNRLNAQEFNTTFEFWFSAEKGGAKCHVDEHCENTLSVQLAGKKRWRLGVTPRMDSVATAQSFNDGQIDAGKWKPEYTFTLNTGEGLFFPPSTLHETKNVGSGCAASVTFQFSHPAPSHFMRNYLGRLSQAYQVAHCMSRWSTTALGLRDGEPIPSSPAKMQAAARLLWTRLDKQGAGSLSLVEVEKAANGLKGRRGVEAREWARDFFAFHDANQDGTLTKKEFAAGFRAFVMSRLIGQRARVLLQRYKAAMRNRNFACPEEQVKVVARLAAVLEHKLRTGQTKDYEAILQKVEKLSKTCKNLLLLARKTIEETRIDVATKTKPSAPSFEASPSDAFPAPTVSERDIPEVPAHVPRAKGQGRARGGGYGDDDEEEEEDEEDEPRGYGGRGYRDEL